MRRVFLRLLIAFLFLASTLPGFFLSAKAASTTLCGQFDTVNTENGYVVQNNIWNGASNSQCIQVDTTTGAFTITKAENSLGTSGPPASYPSIFRGCHWGKCSPASELPIQVTMLASVTSSWNITTVSSGAWDAAYDIWLSPSQNTSGGYNGGAEIMIWLNSRGVQPAGSRIATVSLANATWEVWYTFMGWNYIAYRRTQPASTVSNLDILSFIQDAADRGYVDRSWYLHAIEAGFELWQGGVGMRSNSFSVTISTSGATHTPTSMRTPTATLHVPSPTRTQTPTLSPSSTPSPTPAEPRASCVVKYTIVNDWGNGATVNVTIQNNMTSPINGWNLQWKFPGNQRIREIWNAKFVQNGRNVKASNESWNATIPANGGKVSFGFNLRYSGVNRSPTAFTLNGIVCNTPELTPSPTSPPVTPTPTRLSSTAPPTATLSPLPTATPPLHGQCTVEYAIYSDWGKGATIGVTIWNNTSASINGWNLTWRFPEDQQITQLWNAIYTQNGKEVSASNQTWNAVIPANGAVNFGFNISHSGQNHKPATFFLNGTPCGLR